MAARPAVGSPRAVPPRSEGRGLYVSELQRSRLLDAAFALVYERGYQGMTVHRVAERAGVSNRTFYELFSDREDCFLAAFEQALHGLAAAARPAYEAESEWMERMRGGLAALLETLDREPAARRLVFVESLSAGPRVLERRARALQGLAVLIDEGREGTKAAGELPGIVAEGIVGAAFGVIHARLLGDEHARVAELLNGLMATIVLPYKGSEAAAREYARPTMPSGGRGASHPPGRGTSYIRTQGAWRATHASDRLSPNGGGRRDAPPIGALNPVDFRLTIRTQMALTAVAELSGRAPRRVASVPASGRPANAGFRLTARTHIVLTAIAQLSEGNSSPSNVQVAKAAGVRDQGQISKLLRRLEAQGLLHNTGGATPGIPNAWHLTPRGEDLVHAGTPLSTSVLTTKESR